MRQQQRPVNAVRLSTSCSRLYASENNRRITFWKPKRIAANLCEPIRLV